MRYGYRNGNYIVTIDPNTGTKIRTSRDDEFRPEFAESIDVTMTYECDGGCSKRKRSIDPKFGEFLADAGA